MHPLTDSCRRAAQILCGGRKKNTLKDVFARIRAYTFAWRAHRRGFVDFMYRNWLRGVQEDNQTAHTTRAQKRWAHKRGFYSYRIAQYGLTEENYRSFLSDYQYKRLRPLKPTCPIFWRTTVSTCPGTSSGYWSAMADSGFLAIRAGGNAAGAM